MTQPAGVHFPEREAEVARILAARVRGPEGFAATLAFVEQTMLTENVVAFVQAVLIEDEKREGWPIANSPAFIEWANRIAAEVL